MTYSTIADRSALAAIHLPDDLIGTTFRVTITPVSDIEERRRAFERLKGVLGSVDNADHYREERINEITAGH